MKKKTLLISILAALTGIGMVSCGPGDSSSHEEPSSSIAEVWATRVKITQPGVLTVGEKIKLSQLVEVSLPNAEAKYTTEIKSGEDVVRITDNEIEIIGAGTAAVQIKNQTLTLGQINITALTQNGKKLQEWVDGLNNDHLLDAVWNQIDTVWAEDTTDGTYTYTEGMGLLVTPDYVIDGTYGLYSSMFLDKADGDCYKIKLLDSAGAELDYSTGFAAQLDRATQVVAVEKAPATQIQNYFVIDDLLQATDYTEGEDGWFTLNDGTTAQTLIGGLFGMTVTSYTGVSARLKLADDVLHGLVKFDAKNTTGCAVEFTLTKGKRYEVLENAVATVEPPAKIDVSGLAAKYATFDKNFRLDFEIGVFDKTNYKPLENYYKYNTKGTVLFRDDSIVMAYATRDEETGALGEAIFAGTYQDENGIHSIDIVENTLAVKTTPDTAEGSIFDNWAVGTSITYAILDGASLTLTTSDNTNIYGYTGSFDKMALFRALEGLSPMRYNFASKGDAYNAYTEGYIYEGEDYIRQLFYVRLSMGYQGYDLTLSEAGKVESPVNKKTWEVFPEYFTQPTE